MGELLGVQPSKGGERMERIIKLVLALAALIQACAEFLWRLAELIRVLERFFGLR